MAAAEGGNPVAVDAAPQGVDPSIRSQALSHGAADSGQRSLAQGMYVTLWPKIERCHNYVAVLLAAEEQLQETVDQLVAALKESEKADANSLVGYADRLKGFPSRVEKLHRKLEIIEDRLLVLKDARSRAISKLEVGDIRVKSDASPSLF